MYGFSVFSSEIDDRGIDFVIRNNRGQHYDVQVKTITDKNYTFIAESKFSINLIICLVILKENEEPNIYLFKGSDWESDQSGLFNCKKYPSSKEADYGVNITKSRLEHLENYEFSKVIISIE